MAIFQSDPLILSGSSCRGLGERIAEILGVRPGLLESRKFSDDETFVKALLFLRLEFPAAHLSLTTRESAALRDTLLPLGITKISAGVSTSPGGYSASELADAPQFSIRDERSLGEMVERVRSAGLVPSFQ